MKFAICNETFQDWPFEKAFDFARNCGYTGIEFAPFTIEKNAFDIPATRRAEVRSQAEKAGLEVVGLHWLLAFTEGYYLTSPDAEVRQKTGAYFSELARLCRDLGRIGAGPGVTATTQLAAQRLAPTGTAIRRRCDPAGDSDDGRMRSYAGSRTAGARRKVTSCSPPVPAAN